MACLGGSRPPPFYYEIWSTCSCIYARTPMRRHSAGGPRGPQDGARGPQQCARRGPRGSTRTDSSSLPPQEAPGGSTAPPEASRAPQEAPT
eukprot:1312517-Pyramimonas_sp.AAC.1